MGSRKIKIGVAAAVMAAAFIYMVLSSIGGTGSVVYSYTVSQFLSSAGTLDGVPTRIAGKVQSGSIQKDMGTSQIRFRLGEDSGSEGALNVVYPRMTTPDAFKDDAAVEVVGAYSRERGNFLAKQIVTKCPSKYDAKSKETTAGPAGAPDRARSEPGASAPAPPASAAGQGPGSGLAGPPGREAS